MKRSDAISKASKFLGRDYDVKSSGTANKIKKKSKKNSNLNRARVNQVVADIYQRGVDPKDLDLEKIDWSVSYQNIRNQVGNLLDKRGVDSFSADKRREENAMQDYARDKESEQLMTIARVRNERRDAHAQYIDSTKEAERKFGRLNDATYKKWSRNPNKYDIEGIDGRKEKGRQKPLPFRKNSKSRIKDMMMSNVEQDLNSSNRPAEINSANLMSKDSSISGSDKLDVDTGGDSVKISDSRSAKEVDKSINGGTSEKSKQKGLREQGFLSKKSEKTLDKWDGNYV